MYKTIIIILFATILSCSKGKYIDKELSSQGWTLIKITDSDDNIILERPDSLNSEIYLVFTSDHRIIGHTPTYTLSSTYTINGKKELIFGDLDISLDNLCCDWEIYFLKNYRAINSYSIENEENLVFYFNNNKMIFVKN